MSFNYWSDYYGSLDPWGTLTLTETSPPQSFTEPFTLAEIKSYLRIPDRSFADLDEDKLLLELIQGARAEAEIRQRRQLVRKSWDLTLDYWPGWGFHIELLKPLVSVDLAQYRDATGITTTMVSGTDYIADTTKSILLPPYNVSWPTFSVWPSGGILVRFTSGYASNSSFWQSEGVAIKQGMRELISKWYYERLRGESNGKMPEMIERALSFGERVTVR